MELQTPQVGAELLELERVLHVLVGLVAVQQEHVHLVDGAALHLTPGDHVDSVELLLGPGGTVRSGTHDVHLVSNLRIQYQTLVWIKSAIKWKVRGWKWSRTHFISCLKSTNKRIGNCIKSSSTHELFNNVFYNLCHYWTDLGKTIKLSFQHICFVFGERIRTRKFTILMTSWLICSNYFCDCHYFLQEPCLFFNQRKCCFLMWTCFFLFFDL